MADTGLQFAGNGKNEERITMNHLLSVIGKQLIKKEETVSVAESVTAGSIQAALSLGKNALNFFAGGITTYNINQKVKHLKVNRQHAARVNCVSRRVASEMADHAAKLFKTQWAIAITGYAAPVPEKKVYRLFAWLAIVYKGRVVTAKKIQVSKVSPQKAQDLYKKKALQLFARCLAEYKTS